MIVHLDAVTDEGLGKFQLRSLPLKPDDGGDRRVNTRKLITLAEFPVLNALDCHGPNISPALMWSDPPKGTKSYALVLDDYEARGGDGFTHWAIYNIPATTTKLPANAGANEGDIPNGGGRHAYNDFLKRSYGGQVLPALVARDGLTVSGRTLGAE